MLATVFAEHFGIQPSYAHAVQVGGATGLAMTMLAHHLVDAGVAKHVLVVGGENRLTGQSRDASIQALAQVGHPDYEVPLGPTIPAYYGLVASRYMHEYGVTQEDLAEFAVLMRAHALTHPGAQFHEPITVADVMASKPVAMPLKLLDCCPVSDGGAAFVISREPTGAAGVRVRGCAQAHTHQHVTAAPALSELGAEIAIAQGQGRVRRRDLRCPLRRGLRQLHHHAGDAAGRPRPRRTRRGGGAGAGRAFRPRRRDAAQHPWRAVELRPLRRRRRDGASGRNAFADDGPRRRRGRSATPRWRCCTATAACCRRMSACSWSGCDERHDSPTGPRAAKRSSISPAALAAKVQYFRRSFCAACGAPDPVDEVRQREGTVYATSLVCRAATPETRAHVPYNIVLVDTAEGFRMMAHGDNDLAIGDKVTARYRPFAGRLVPYFGKERSRSKRRLQAAKQSRPTRNG